MKNLLVVGGDKRMLRLSELLKEAGYKTSTLGLVPGDEGQARIDLADALLFPYPFSVKNGSIPSLTGMMLDPEKVLEHARHSIPLFAGKGLEPYALAQDVMPKCFRLRRYAQADGFEQRNAKISAEAAIYEAMTRMEHAVMDLHVLVTGYGLFGEALAKLLQALGAQVWVSARRPEVLHQAEMDGMKPVRLSEMEYVLNRMDLVMNTIPSQVFTERTLRCIRPGTWMMELASAPYGFDLEQAQVMGLHCALLPALPARYAPQSAALALRDAVTMLLKEEEK